VIDGSLTVSFWVSRGLMDESTCGGYQL